jgi:hypothetical protein
MALPPVPYNIPMYGFDGRLSPAWAAWFRQVALDLVEAGSSGATISDTAFAASWNGNTTDGASKNALYDKLASIDTDVAAKLAKASNLADLPNAATARGNLGLGTMATQATTSFSQTGHTHVASDITGGAVAVDKGGTSHQSYTKGDLLAATGATTLGKLAVGSDGTVLTADSSQTTGLNWTTPLTNPMTTGGDIIYGGASGVATRLANGSANQYLASAGGTSAPAWTSFVAPTVQKFTSGSGTYTLPSSPRAPIYIRVRMVGGGGGGGGSGTTAGSGATAGGTTTFGTTLLSAGGGSGGGRNSVGGAGGTASLGAGPIGSAFTGAAGSPASLSGTSPTSHIPGGKGGQTPFGGGGMGGANSGSGAGGAAATNTGSGGGGAWGPMVTNGASGSGGGAGAFVDAIITSPSSTYSYAVGAGGSGQAAGASGAAGGAGAAGYIEVTEYYQ